MGEAYNYEEMLQIEAERDRAERIEEERDRLDADLQAEKWYSQQGDYAWQSECPFVFGDVVYSARDKMEGRVIGLPLQEWGADEGDDWRGGKAWVHFTNDQREWVAWTELKHLRRSPAREKRARTATPRPTAATIQMKLHLASRGEGGGISGSSAGASSPGPSLSMPARAEIERDRSVARKPPAGVRGRQQSGHVTKEAHVSIPLRLGQFPDQGLRDSCGKLFCGPCCVVLQNIKSTITAHCDTAKHKRKLELFNARTSSDVALMSDLSAYFASNPELAGGTNVSPNDQLFRYRVTESLLNAGIPIEKAKHLRPLLERTGRSLTSPAHLQSYIPKIEATELHQIAQELVGMLVSIIFDGTTRVGELVNVVARWISFDFYICQRLIALVTFKKHLNGVELAAFLTQLLLTQMKIPIVNLLTWLRDSAAVNGAASWRLSNTFTGAEDIMCMPHTLCHVGEHFVLNLMNEFLSLLIQLMQKSGAAKSIWRGLIGESVVGYSSIRWYATAEFGMQVARNFHLVPKLLDRLRDDGIALVLAPKVRSKYDENRQLLRRQMAGLLDMRPLVATTYDLEGDGLVQMLAFEKIEALRVLGRSLHQPGVLSNLAAVIRESAPLAQNTAIQKHWDGYGLCDGSITAIGSAQSTLYPGQTRTVYTVTYPIDGTSEDLEEEEVRPLLKVVSADIYGVVSGLFPGFDYLEQRLTGTCAPNYSLVHQYHIFEIIRIFDPTYAAAHATPQHVNSLAVVKPIAAHNLIPGLLSELPMYLSLAASSPAFERNSVRDYTDQLLRWWRNNHCSISVWAKAARIVFGLSCTSAASERVFSLVNNMYGTDQLAVLADQIQAAAMLRYNKRLVG